MKKGDKIELINSIKVTAGDGNFLDIPAGTKGILNEIDSEGGDICVININGRFIFAEADGIKITDRLIDQYKEACTTATFWKRKSDGLYLKVDSTRGHTKLNDTYSHVESIYEASHFGKIPFEIRHWRKNYDSVQCDVYSKMVITVKDR